jgi:hypothetical protein
MAFTHVTAGVARLLTGGRAVLRVLGTVVCLVSVAVPACGSDQQKTDAGFTGNVSGPDFVGRSGGFDSLGQEIMLLEFADAADLCALSATGKPPTVALTWLTVFICTGEGSSLGDYVIGPGNPETPCTRGAGWAWMREFNSGGPQMGGGDAVGSVTITSGSNTLEGTSQPVAGSLQVAFGSGTDFSRTYAGSFSVSYCSTLNQ